MVSRPPRSRGTPGVAPRVSQNAYSKDNSTFLWRFHTGMEGRRGLGMSSALAGTGLNGGIANCHTIAT